MTGGQAPCYTGVMDALLSSSMPGEPIRVLGTGYSLSDIARGTGVTLSHISRVFRGERTPSMPTANAIATFLGITVDRLYAELSKTKAA